MPPGCESVVGYETVGPRGRAVDEEGGILRGKTRVELAAPARSPE